MVQVINFTNRKGGVGKSTLAAHVAAWQATMGYRVGIIDTDSQGHMALMFRELPTDGLYNVLVEGVPIGQEVIVIPPDRYSTPDHPAQGELFLLPSYRYTHTIPSKLRTEVFKFVELCDQLGEIAHLDFIILDSQPSMSDGDALVWMAVDWFAYVTEPAYLAMHGLQDVMGEFTRFSQQRQKYMGRKTNVACIIPNMFRTNTQANQMNIEDLVEDFKYFHNGGLTMSPIHLSETIKRACEVSQMVYTYEPTSRSAQQLRHIAEGITERVLSWHTQKT